MRGFVAVDIETTGLDPLHHEVIEVGMIIDLPDHPEVYPVEFSLAFDENKADPEALAVNGWGSREFAPLINPRDAALVLHENLDDVHIVGKNPTFDAGFLEVFLKRHGYQRNWHHRLVDVGSLFWGWYNAIHDDEDLILEPPKEGIVRWPYVDVTQGGSG